MPAKSLKIDSLELDLENPCTLASDQRNAMQKIITEQKVRLSNLAESIAVKGFHGPLKVPPLVGSMQITEDHAGILRRA